jgi:DNA-binding transcriptional LysR family regulator
MILGITVVNGGHRMKIDDLDLNLLRVLHALLRERQVSRAAESLGVTQPAVSNALARLRRALGDPLFVRSSSGMLPTPVAERLSGPVSQALAGLQAALDPAPAFDPATSLRRFTLGLSDIGEIYFLPKLMRHLRDTAPGVTLSTVRPLAIRLHESLEAGAVDLAIGHLPAPPAGFHLRRLFDQRYVCLLRAGHPLWAGRDSRPRTRLSLDDFTKADHLVIVSAGTSHGLVEESLRRQGVHRRVALTVPHFVATGHLLASTDLIATVPERLAERMTAPFGLVALGHPVELPRSPITMVWHGRLHRDDGHHWLRQALVRLFGPAG